MPSERKTWGCGGRDHDRLYRGHYSGLGHRWRRHGNRCRNLDGGGRAADHIVRSQRHRWLRRYLRRRVTCRGLAEQHRGSCNCYQSKYTCRNFTICDLWFSEGSLCKHSRAGDTANCTINKEVHSIHPHLCEAHQRATEHATVSHRQRWRDQYRSCHTGTFARTWSHCACKCK